MIAGLRTLCFLGLTALLAACTSTPSSNLGELPRTQQGSLEQLLQQASVSPPEQANELLLAAADLAHQQNDDAQAARILQQVPMEGLKPAQQIFNSTLKAELAMARKKPKSALKALAHPSFARLSELPVEQQLRSQLVRAKALEANGQPLDAARERVFIAPLLSGSAANSNHETIWTLVASLPAEQLQSAADADLAGWLALARAAKSSGSPEQQQSAIDTWVAQNPQHPAAKQLPQALTQLKQQAAQPLSKIALLLPQEGPLTSVAQALRDGFMASYYQSQQNGETPPVIELYDSSKLTSMDDFYRQAQASGVQLVVGPLEKPLVKQLNERSQLPITTLALNYSDNGKPGPAQLYQFGLSAEDEARAVARRAWDDGMRRAVALVPRGEWGDRVLEAFRQSWLAKGGTLIAAEHVDQPVQLAQQIAELFQLRQSEARAKRLQNTLGSNITALPVRRQDVDFIFLAATPQQAQQIKPTLAFQYAGDVPVYATSHLNSGNNGQTLPSDLSGIRFCETPWLLDHSEPMHQQVVAQWPQAAGSLGRLYAMGIDAYNLAPRLGQLKNLPDSHIDGHTGQLSMDSAQRIERSLPWAEIQNGQVQRLP